MRGQRGFTLLEILIALSIVSILAVVAVPIYLDYEVRAKITEGFAVADPVKEMVIEYHTTTGTWPASNVEAAVGAPNNYKSDYVDSISVIGNAAGAAITITYSIPALGANNTIILTPKNPAANIIRWSCAQGTVLNKYRPATCKS